MTHHMPCGERLLNVTWKGEDAQFWVLSRPLAPDEVPQTYRFKATTSYGFFEGEVIIMESLCK